MQQISSKTTIVVCILCLLLAYGTVLLFGASSTIDKYTHNVELTEVLENHFKKIWNSETIADLPDKYSIAHNKTIFIKTHKTGSSTLTGILWRQLCEKEQRHCFLPPRSNPGRTWDFDKPTHRQYVMKKKGLVGRSAPFDVWLHHVKRHDFLFRNVVNLNAGAKMKFLSIVRHPVDRFRSAWTWYSLGSSNIAKKKYHNSKGNENEPYNLESFVSHQLGQLESCGPKQHISTNLLSEMFVWGYWICSVFQYSWLFSAPPQFRYRTGLDATAEELVGKRSAETGFHHDFLDLLGDVFTGKVLLLVCDRFEESLLILERAVFQLQAPPHYGEITTGKHMQVGNISEGLHWPQLLYLRQKVQVQIEPLSSVGAQGLLELQPYDHALYRAANIMLDRYILQLRTELGEEEYEHDLNRLKEQNKLIAELCGEDDVDGGAGVSEGLAAGDARHLCAYLRRDNAELVRDAWESIGDNMAYQSHG